MKRLGLNTIAHPKPYTIGWLHQGRNLHVSHQCHLPYNIKPFTDKVLCDISTLEVCYVLLGQPHLWKKHVIYESRPHSMIITLDNKLYWISEVAPPIAISLITAKKCNKIISQTKIFFSLSFTPGKEEGYCHDFQGGILCITTSDGQGHGGVQGYFCLTHKGTSALSGQALHQFDPWHVISRWNDLSMLCYG